MNSSSVVPKAAQIFRMVATRGLVFRLNISLIALLPKPALTARLETFSSGFASIAALSRKRKGSVISGSDMALVCPDKYIYGIDILILTKVEQYN